MDKDNELTVSQKFDSLYQKIQKFLNDDESITTTVEQKSELAESLKSELEEITRTISALDMFSTNESYKEMDPNSLKFLLLPYFLGLIWQYKSSRSPSDRKEIIDTEQVYFKDFLERMVTYGLIKETPKILLQIASESSQGVQNNGSGDSSSVAKSFKPPTGDELRQIKIAKFKENKELDEKIKILQERQKSRDIDDDAVTQELYVSLLRRYTNQAETELESIVKEKELLSAFAAKAQGKSEPDVKGPPKKSGLPFDTFILTKNDVQKQVFGLGYPSLPIMTVDELYEKRRAEGEWPGPVSGHGHGASSGVNEVPQDEESVNAQADALNDEDNEEARQRQLAMDEYKDEHRRGWGNRMNRS